MIFIEYPHEHGARETAQHLGDDVAGDGGPGEGAREGEAQGDDGVEVRAGHRSGDEHADHHGEAPAEGDDHPAGAFRLGMVEGGGGADAVAEQHEHERAEEFEEVLLHSLKD